MRKLLLLLLCTALVLPAMAQKKKKKKGNGPAATEASKPGTKTSIASKTKGCKKVPGLFTFYQDTTKGEVYMLIRKDQLNKEYIYFAYSENGPVQTGHNRGIFRDNKVISLNKYYDKIEFVKENTTFYFDPENAISKAAEANILRSILSSQKIVAEDKDSLFLIDATALFFSEQLHQMKQSGPGAGMFFNLGAINKDKSKFRQIRSYPENTDIVVEYGFDNSATLGAGKDIADARSVSVILQHSFLAMPDNNFKPRMDDPRVGFFATQVEDMTTTRPVNYRDMIHRWNLEKKDKNAALSEPVEPITWWIENTTPVEWRETIKAAALTWNVAFEKAGFKNAVRVEIQPDTATWDAGDIRYNVLRWTSSPYPPFGGYGPSFVNPRTGQILGADIMLEYIFVTNRVNQNRLYQGSKALPTEEEAHHMGFCSAGEYMHLQTLFGQSVLNSMNAGSTEMERYVKESMYYLILHEMGHTMGLMHNMKSSQLWMPTEINNLAQTQSIGLTGSVMDYPAANISTDRNNQGNYFTTRPGPYDLWAIEYGYSQALDDPKAERERLEKILQRSTEPALCFGNDADDMRFPGFGIDPRVMIGDLSKDAITYATDRMKLTSNLLKDIKTRYAVPGGSYQELKQAYLIATGEYMTQAGVLSRYIGGVYVDRGFAGQPGAAQPYTPVAYTDQKRAMKALSDYVFAPNAMQAPADLYAYLQSQRRGYGFFFNNEDPHIHDRILVMQLNVLAHLLSPNTLQRLTDSRLYGNQYSVQEMVTDLTNAIFQADAAGNVNTLRINLQQEYLDALLEIAATQDKNPYDQVSRAAIMSAVKSIERIAKTPGGNAETQAHRQLMLIKIEKALKS